MSLFKKNKKVPPLTFEEKTWLMDHAFLQDYLKEREMFPDDDAYQAFCDWRYRKMAKDWSYKPYGMGRPGRLGEEWFCWVEEYYSEHPEPRGKRK